MGKSNSFTVAIGSVLLAVLTIVAADIAIGSYYGRGFSVANQHSQVQRLFDQRCARCHSLKPGSLGGLGPPLRNLYLRLLERRLPETPEEYVYSAITQPGAYVVPSYTDSMPKGLAADLEPEVLASLISYILDDNVSMKRLLHVCSQKSDTPSESVDTVIADRSQVALGESIFRTKGKCHDCHSFHREREYSVYGPSLFFRGLKNKAQIIASITDPNASIVPGFGQADVVLATGRILQGTLIDRGKEGLRLIAVASNGKLGTCLLKTGEIDADEKPLTHLASPMPTNFAKELSPEEIEALAVFIQSLN